MALKDDLIQRTIEQLANVINIVLNLKTTEAIQKAEAVIANAYQEHTGSSASLFKHLSTEEIVTLLSSSGKVDREKAYLLAVIFYSDAKLQEAKSGDLELELQLKALDLFLEAGTDDVGEDDIAERIQQAADDLADFVLPETTQWRFFDYAQYTGRFADAEDKLFALLGEYGSSANVVTKGEAFYKRLLRLDDDELEKGNLPRIEVEEGRKAFQEASLGEGS